MSRKSSFDGYDQMLKYSTNPRLYLRGAGNKWPGCVASWSATEPTRDELVADWQAVECVTLARRADGPGYEVIARGFPTAAEAEAKIRAGTDHPSTEQAAA